jgi:ATP-dependent exoDNAse (exonuclease V) beta subunit
MITPRLVMILASAGSGKTFSLTSRFIALLAAGAPPERIVALTFTRKAAGEFFDGILGKLATAAGDEAEAERLAAAIGRPELRAKDFLRLLRAVIDALHRLRLGTLDSFFAQVAQAFPYELGLAGDFEVIEGHAARLERERALRQLFACPGATLDDAQRAFLESFKQATFGTEEKRLAQRMDRFLDEKYETFLEVPAAERWGVADQIWPTGLPWAGQVTAASVASALRRWLAETTMLDGQRARWARLADELAAWSVGAPWGAEMDYFLGRLLPAAADIARGTVEVTVERKKQRIEAAGCAVLVDVLRLVAGAEIARQLAMTQGVHAVLAQFDRVYSQLVRRAGKLTFGDVTRLLRPDAGARGLSFAGGEEGRLELDYRLDASIDHWLLDEFQDTSRGQWSVLRNLIDEVVQDPEERRTFFCVGDVKQSIYAWRDGDPTLMRDIRRYYNGSDVADGPIATQPLDASWRSGPAVIAAVNGVFGAEPVLRALFPKAAVERWQEEWRAHTTERPDRSGQAALLFADDETERRQRTLELLQEIAPLRRGLTCAVLTHSNEQAAEIADFLRREGGLPAVAESDLKIATDNPVGVALLALVHAAAHPGDRFAAEHVAMTPLAGALAAEGLATRAALSRRILGELSEGGYEAWAERWLARLPLAGAFVQERARQFAAAAAQFDATGQRDPDEFVRFMSEYTLREPESAAVVRVMTIHKSKGLGFDVVVLPELQGQKLDRSPSGLSLQRDAEHAPEWVLELPKKEIVDADPVLRAHAERAAADACYEALSLLYVAMTRAKRALFVVVERPKQSANFPRLLVESLGDAAGTVQVGEREFAGGWAAGDPEWFRALTSPPTAAPERGLEAVAAPPAVRHVARRPSGEHAGEVAAARLFERREGAALEFGSAVHALLAEVEACAPAEVETRAAAWRAAGHDAAAIAAAVGVLRAPALADVWQAPAALAAAGGGREVWRERAFEVVLGEEWVTGVFDRVVLDRATDGRVVAATVFDFKTDAVSATPEAIRAGAARHRAQLALYREVLARLTGLPVASVRAEVVFTAVCARADVISGV